MTIQWFPGHMAKARRQITEKLKLIDVVFELVDARLPLSSRNPMLDEIVKQKPRVLLLNKVDLADPQITIEWEKYFKEKGITTVKVNSQAGVGLHQLVKAAKLVTEEKFNKQREKGINPRAIRALILGIPNVGKSTLINRLAKKNLAKTGDKPGVTKAQQWVKVGKELELLDTPGILWPKFEDQEVGYRLAVSGAIKDAILTIQDVGFWAVKYLITNYPNRLIERYNLESLDKEPLDVFSEIGIKKGFKGKDGWINYDLTAEMLLRELRTLKLGQFSLERPSDFN
ncbi:MAG: ribosome biosis GTPase YlqF [Bacillales bacterium]|jgi:ribosome biogenesis GTPase A|nr:ribosome biosis GTPase YlqF [Bacillales bacterium]